MGTTVSYRFNLPKESLTGAALIQFEVKSAQDKVENDFATQNLNLRFKDGTSRPISYQAPIDAWEKRYVELTDVDALSDVTDFRLGANPKEFEGKSLRISGVFLTRIDESAGERHFACLLGNPGGCACCSPGGVLEFEPKGSYKWPTNFPPVESGITVSGLLKMVGHRKNLLNYLAKKDIERYRAIIKKLGLRK